MHRAQGAAGRAARERENVLPDPMPPEGHQVVHAVVGFRYAGEDAGYALHLLGFGDRLKAEVGWSVRVAGNIA